MKHTDYSILPVDGGYMGERIRNHDWASTPLGPAEKWPHSLRAAVAILLKLPVPALLLWGKDLLQFYNDPCRPLLGAGLPDMLGQPFRTPGPPTWQLPSPVYATLLQCSESGIFHHQPLTV